MLFKYKGIDSMGKKVKSKIEAISLNDAKSKLKAKKIIYKTLEEETSVSLSSISFKRKSKIKIVLLSNLSRDLSIYLNSLKLMKLYD